MPLIDSILLDRDGTIIVDKHYLCDPGGVELLPHVADALAHAYREGRRLFVVTNQSGIGRGMFTDAAYQACSDRLESLLAQHGARFTASRYCPHAPDSFGHGCTCRKPMTGMWMSLRTQYGLYAAKSVMIGDKGVDVAFGRRAGLAASILVLTGKGKTEAHRLGLAEFAVRAEQTGGWAECKTISDETDLTPHVVACDVAMAFEWVRVVLEGGSCSE